MSRRSTPLARQSGGRDVTPRRVKRPPLTFFYTGRHRAPVVAVDPQRVSDDYWVTVQRHVDAGRSVADAETLAWIDADDALTAWVVTL